MKEKKEKKLKVLVCDPIGDGGLSILRKEKSLQVDVKTGLDEKALKKVIGEYDAAVVRSGTQFTEGVIRAAKKLRVIGRAGVGVDNVDLAAATRQGVIVMNTPEGNTISTCEHTVSMMLSLARNIPQANQSVKAGDWKRSQFTGSEVHGKILGVVGFGRIGREVAARAMAFGMNVIAFDPFISKDQVPKLGVTLVEFEDLLRQADFVTVHVPLTDETANLIGEKQFALMKKGVYVINCARGGIINETALHQAVLSGKVRGAALDVYQKEPPKDNPLVALPQVITTPHLGAATQEAQENVAIAVCQQVVDALFDRGIKKYCRHNQYFGIKAAQEQIRKREGGIIWHTQGSGKKAWAARNGPRNVQTHAWPRDASARE